MERNWSEDAKAAFSAYPWCSEEDRKKAREEAELVSFGAKVEVDDLPLRVRRFARTMRKQRYVWRGESWDDAVAEFFDPVRLEIHFGGQLGYVLHEDVGVLDHDEDLSLPDRKHHAPNKIP